MQELAGHPDMPDALRALRRRWQPFFGRPKRPLPADGSDAPPAPTGDWKKLFVGTLQTAVTPAEEFTQLRDCWQAVGYLVDPDLAGTHEGVAYLITEYPNIWIAQVVHEFYRLPRLAAEAWVELNYCAHFLDKLAKHIVADADSRWFAGQKSHDEAVIAANAVKRATPADEGAGTPASAWEPDRQNVLRKSAEVGFTHEPPRFIMDLIVRELSPDGWFRPSMATELDPQQVRTRAYQLLADRTAVRDLANDKHVPVPFSMMLQGELEQIRQTREWVGAMREGGERITSTPREPVIGESARHGAPIRQSFREDLLGLAFSGGGIRSATFNLGVLQSLAKIGLLKHCDYLSTVSGGGYIGGWFTAWMYRQSGKRARPDAINEMQRRLSPVRNPNPVADAVRPIRYLREYSNYLTPRTGFLSADTWTMIGIFTRNALLNQVILVSLFAGLLLAPRAIVWLAGIGADSARLLATLVPILLIAGLVLLATTILIKNLRRLDPLGSEDRPDEPAAASRAIETDVPMYARPLAIQFGVVLPWLVATSLLLHRFPGALHGVSLERFGGFVSTPLIVGMFMAVYVAILLGFGRTSRSWERDPFGLVRAFGWAILVSGVTAGVVTWVAITLFMNWGLNQGPGRQWHTVILGGPVSLLIFSLSIVIVLGMLGERFPDEHREWWSRLRTFIHMYALGVFVWFAMALYVPWAWRSLQDNAQQWGGWGALLTWIGSTFAGVKAGGSAEEKNGNAPPPSITATLIRVVTFVAPYVFIVGLIVVISLVLDAVAHNGYSASSKYWEYVTNWNETGSWMFGLTAGCFLVGILFSSRVDINAFSMHHFYKNRLVRCYLGASHEDRKADWFTGFDPDDDLRLAKLDHANPEVEQKYAGPYPIVNCALNLVGGKDLAWQERKAESFVFTPKYCGYDLDRAVLNKSTEGYSEAYVRTTDFYRQDHGPLLGMAMAISGAAANPNMGRATSPASAFLLTVFNARLGWWVGNTRHAKSASRPGPPFGLAYTARELTGSTDDEKPYVNVSDGGHFENLGVYELIRRGCRYIIACDAGQDGDFMFQDLGDLVRRCRTDFGVEIDISLDRIRNRDENKWSQVHCVVGKIHYLNIPKRDWRGQLLNQDGLPLRRGDRPAHETGYLIYLKPSITGDEPHDVLEYGLRVPQFPHESTADQWFNESQFEAYRRLGMHIAEHAFSRFQDDRTQVPDIGWLFGRLYKFWYPPTTVIGQHATEHTQAYSKIMEHVRSMPALGLLDHTFFDGLPVAPPPPSAGGGTPRLDPRDEFYVINSLIQLMEDVYADLHLEDNYDHPHVEGWMAVFRRWVTQEAFRRTWAISRSTYAERFRRFYDDRLVKRHAVRRQLTFPMNFIASHRGLIKTAAAGGPDGNTMADFRAAIDAGTEVIELDVRQLQGGTLVVFHDDRIAGQPLSLLTHTAFLQLAGPLQVPTLSTVLDELRGKVLLDIELKDQGSVSKVLAEIRETAWNTDDFVLTSFHADMPSQVKALREDVQTGLLLEKKNLAAEMRLALERNDMDFIAPQDCPELTWDLLEECAAKGMPIVPWTVNDQQRMHDVFKHPAVAGLITEEVELARWVRRSVR